MELSVTVRGLKGGVDLVIMIRISEHKGETRLPIDDPHWFTAADLADWAAANDYDRQQASALFTVLYVAAQERKLELAWECTRGDGCTGKNCRMLHKLAGFAYGLVQEDELIHTKGIAGRRLPMALAYRDEWSGRLPAGYNPRR